MKPNERDERLQQLAAHIADNRSVDWAGEADALHSADSAALGMRELERIAQGFRQLHSADGCARPDAAQFAFGALQVMDRLGQGTQGEVWRAYDPMLDMQVALKLRRLDGGALGHEFLAEARRLARVRHANIVSVYGAAVEDGRAGLWMELIRGTTLADLLAREGRLSAAEVGEIGIDLCRALAAVHRHGLVHGDIKPENIMREVSGRTVLMDFGVAREADAAPGPAVSGSLRYLAPEVLQGSEPSVASDLYALGASLFRLLTGEYADKDSLRAAHTARVGGRGNDARLLATIERALDPNPARRFASALAFAQALDVRLPRAAMWRPLIWAAALAGFVVIAGLAWRAWWGADIAIAWQPQASMRRLDSRGDAELPSGSAIALGDRLALDFRSDRPAWVYVFDDDGSGEAAVLFPLSELAATNPLAAGASHHLPTGANGVALSWQVSRAAARDVFIVLAADAAQPAIENRIRDWQHAQRIAAPSTRGALELAPAPDGFDIDAPGLRAILAQSRAAQASGHVRVWRFELPHRGD